MEPTIAGAVGTGDTRPSSSVTCIAIQRRSCLPSERSRKCVVRDEKHRTLALARPKSVSKSAALALAAARAALAAARSRRVALALAAARSRRVSPSP